MSNNNKPVNGISEFTEQFRFWDSELKASQEELKDWHELSEKIVKRYNDEREPNEVKKQKYNLFATNTDILQAALFARIPEPDISRRYKDAEDQVGRVAANILQRAIKYELDNDNNFSEKAKNAIQDFLLSGMGVARVRYALDVPDDVSISDDAETQAEANDTDPEIVDERTPIDYVQCRNFLYSPAETWDQVRWIAFKSTLNKSAIKKRFGDDIAEAIAFKISKERAEKKRSISQAEIYEIWDLNSRKVFWFSFDYHDLLDEKDDPLGLPGFFPTVKPMFANPETTRLIPHPDYDKVKGQYEELDLVNARITVLMKTLAVKGVYNDAAPGIKDLVNSAENKMLPVEDWAGFADKGGVAGNMEFFPLETIQRVLAGLYDSRDRIISQIYQLTGISDIVRGEGQMYATATAEQLKSQYASLRLTVKQQSVASFMSGLVQLKAYLMCKFYEPERLLARAGQLASADTPFIEPAMALLKQADLTHFRIEVSIDSLQAPDWNSDKQARTELVMSMSQFLGQALPAAKETPEIAPLMAKLLQFTVAGFKGAQDIEGEIQDGLKKLQESAMKKASTPPPPPPPSDAQINADVKKMELQMKDAHAKGEAEIAQKEFEAKRQFDIQQGLHAHEIQKLKLELDARRYEADNVIEQRKLALAEQTLQLEKLKTLVSARDASRQINGETGFGMPTFDGLSLSNGSDGGLDDVVNSQMANMGADVNNTQLVTKDDMAQAIQHVVDAFTATLQGLANAPVPEQHIEIQRPDGTVYKARIH